MRQVERESWKQELRAGRWLAPQDGALLLLLLPRASPARLSAGRTEALDYFLHGRPGYAHC